MEPGSIYDGVITRYLLNEAGPEEKEFVLEWMAADDKNRLYVEALQNTLQLVGLSHEIATINVESEWEQFRQVAFRGQAQVLQFDKYNVPEWETQEEERQNRRTRVYKILFGSAIAASVIFMIGLGAGWFSSEVKQENSIAQKAAVTKEKAKIDPLMAVIQHEVNTSGKTKRLILPDGSKIALFDNSELTYKEPADGKSRAVYLVGKADFQIAKNKAKPFTVFSEDIFTTAIGTEFTVTAIKKENFIIVRLNEGKVVVRSLKGRNQKLTNGFYLTPVQELLYDKSSKAVKIRSINEKRLTDSRVINKIQDSPSIPHYGKGSWFMFNNQLLSEIFDALSDMYDVKIVYAKKDVKNKYFIGTYERSEPLENILNQIANLNDLKVTKEDSTYRIRKK